MNCCEQIRAKYGTYGLPEEIFYSVYGAWTHTPCYSGNDMVAVGLNNGPEIHLAILVEPTPNLRRVLNTAARPVLDWYGYMTTTVPEEDEVSRKFVERIGFKRVGRTDIGYTYRLDRADWRY